MHETRIGKRKKKKLKLKCQVSFNKCTGNKSTFSSVILTPIDARCKHRDFNRQIKHLRNKHGIVIVYNKQSCS